MKTQGYSYIKIPDKSNNANERKAKMIEMKKNGVTYAEIGKTFNLSKQRVYSIIGGQFKAYYRELTPEDCIYPNVRKWLNDNRISRAELCRRVYGSNNSNARTSNHNFLTGKARDMRKSTIDKYLKATGLTYEELFETEGE